MEREKYFAKLAKASTKVMQLRRFGKQDKSLEGGSNDSFKSLEVGKIVDACASVRTATIQYEGKDKDVVVMNTYDTNSDEEVEVIFSKEDCLEFMSYLATAAYSLRN